MSFRIWTNDTRRDEDKNRSPRAESTAARYECQKPRPAGTSNPGQTRACFTAVQTKDSPACPSVCPYIVRFSIHNPASKCMRACTHFVRTFMYVMLCQCKQSEPAGRRHTHQTDRDQSACFGCHTQTLGLVSHPQFCLPAYLTVRACMQTVPACSIPIAVRSRHGTRGLDRFDGFMAGCMGCDTISPWPRVVPFLGQ